MRKDNAMTRFIEKKDNAVTQNFNMVHQSNTNKEKHFINRS